MCLMAEWYFRAQLYLMFNCYYPSHPDVPSVHNIFGTPYTIMQAKRLLHLVPNGVYFRKYYQFTTQTSHASSYSLRKSINGT